MTHIHAETTTEILWDNGDVTDKSDGIRRSYAAHIAHIHGETLDTPVPPLALAAVTQPKGLSRAQHAAIWGTVVASVAGIIAHAVIH